jgi:hypothetical protein
MTGGRDTSKLTKRNDTLAIGTRTGFMLNDSISLRQGRHTSITQFWSNKESEPKAKQRSYWCDVQRSIRCQEGFDTK